MGGFFLSEINDFFDENGFVTIPVRFETVTDLEFHAQEFYEQIFEYNINNPEKLRHYFRNYCKNKHYSETEQSLVALALDVYYEIDGMDPFIEY